MNTTGAVRETPKKNKGKVGRPKTGRNGSGSKVYLNDRIKRLASRLACKTNDRSLSAMAERLLAKELLAAGMLPADLKGLAQ